MLICRESSDQEMLQRGNQAAQKFFNFKIIYKAFRLEYQGIKNLSWVQSSDQGKFSVIKQLDPGRKWFHRRYVSDYPLYDQYKICLYNNFV